MPIPYHSLGSSLGFEKTLDEGGIDVPKQVLDRFILINGALHSNRPLENAHSLGVLIKDSVNILRCPK
jgi:hypothetical protein